MWNKFQYSYPICYKHFEEDSPQFQHAWFFFYNILHWKSYVFENIFRDLQDILSITLITYIYLNNEIWTRMKKHIKTWIWFWKITIEEINRHKSISYWPSSIIDRIQCFCFRYFMAHAAKNVEENTNQKLLESIFKLFFLFATNVYYKGNYIMNIFEINCINCN